MASDENLLEIMIERATNANDEIIDELAVQMFCMIVRNNSSLIHKAIDLIVLKIRSSNTTESTRAISLLEECMCKCGMEFQDEISKFRFLNDLIRLVSKKYQGAETPSLVKEKIMDCLLLWTTEYPQRNKIREAYDMLRKEGVEHEVSSISTSKRDNIMGIDEQKLRKLIQSGEAQNFKRANLLIQYRVNQDARRTELMLRHKSELQEVHNTVIVLNQMLDNYEQNHSDRTEETINLIKDLYSSCKRYEPVIQRLPELIENDDENLIAETLQTYDILQAVMQRYVDIIDQPKTLKLESEQAASCVESTTVDLLSDLLDNPKDLNSTNGSNNLDEIIFGDTGTENPNNLKDMINLLEPTRIEFKKKDTFDSINQQKQTEKPSSFRNLKEIDEISQSLIQVNLNSGDRCSSFKKKSERISLNDLVKVKSSSVTPEMTQTNKNCENILNKKIEIKNKAELRTTNEGKLSLEEEVEKLRAELKKKEKELAEKNNKIEQLTKNSDKIQSTKVINCNNILSSTEESFAAQNIP